MNLKHQTLIIISLLLALLACCCCLAQQRQPPQPPPQPASELPPPGLISALLREQVARRITTTTEIPPETSAATRVPSSSSSSSTVFVSSTPSALTSQQFSVPQTTTTTTTSTAPQTTTTTTTNANQFQYVKPLSGPKCNYNNVSYSIGQKWIDDCVLSCECILNSDTQLAISACRPKCPVYGDPPGDNCTLERNEEDNCCLKWNCKLEAKFAPSTTTMQTERGQLNMTTTEIKMPSPVLADQAAPVSAPVEMSARSEASSVASSVASPTTTTTAAVVSPSTTTTTTTTTSLPPTTTSTVARIASKAPITTTTTAAAAPTTTTTAPRPPTTKKVIDSVITTTTTQRQVPTTTQIPPTTTTNLLQRQSRPPAAASSSSNTPNNQRAPKQVSAAVERMATTVLATQSPSSNTLPPLSLVTTAASISAQLEPQLAAAELADVEARARPQPALNVEAPASSEAELSSDTEAAEPEPEVDPFTTDLCIESYKDNTTAYRLADAWKLAPCNQTCRCVFRSEPRNPLTDVSYYHTFNLRNNSAPTEIRCGLPPRCQAVLTKLVATPACPQPRLILPQPQTADKCACPQVTCPPPVASTTPASQAATSLSTSPVVATTLPSRLQPPPPTTTTTTTTEAPSKGGCLSRQHGGRYLAVNETFTDECHSICRCSEDSEIRCQQLVCPSEPPSDVLCADWSVEANFKPNSSENKCCPAYICKKSSLDEEPLAGEKFPPQSTTTDQSTSSSTATPESSQPTQTSETSPVRSCSLLGRVMAHGEAVPEELQGGSSGGSCNRACKCADGKIVCEPSCPPVGEQPPEDLDCPESKGTPHLITEDCCTRWECKLEERYQLQRFEVVPLNASNVEMTIWLPLFAIGRRGSFRLNYTGVPSQEVDADDQSGVQSPPPANVKWLQRPNIVTNGGLFPTQLIKYHMGGLRANHRYWFEVSVHFDSQEAPFDSPMLGPIQSVVMPQPATTKPMTVILQPVHPKTTTTTTTTKTTPTPSTTTKVTSSPSTTTTTMATTTSTTTTTTTPQPPSTSITALNSPTIHSTDGDVMINKPGLTSDATFEGSRPGHGPINQSPCNHLDAADRGSPQPWTDMIHSQMNAPLQKYAWYLLVAFSIMTILFTIVSYLYLKKSSRVVAPITSHQSAYDNPTFTKLVSYYANQPHVLLLDENSQNYNNDVILAKQKNLEVDKSSPLHHHNNNNNNNINNNNHHQMHQMNDLHHHNGRQHLI